jgi:hypothetical protein
MTHEHGWLALGWRGCAVSAFDGWTSGVSTAPKWVDAWLTAGAASAAAASTASTAAARRVCGNNAIRGAGHRLPPG